MNRVINDPDLVVEDMLHGWLIAHADTLASTANPRVIKRIQAPQTGKVGIVTGGGSGHEPAFLGYVGNGLVDAVAIGEIFSSPTAKSFLDAMRHANGGAGIACLYGNYAGDNMNVGMAVEMARQEGMTVRCVVANDDVASAPKGQENKRRGVAGEILMWKAAAAKADMGGSLDEVIALAQKAIHSTRSIGIGLSACIIPAVGKANFNIAPGSMEVGIGHHGEPGIDVRATVSAKEMAQMMLGFAQRNRGMTRVLCGEALVNEDVRLQARASQITDRIDAAFRQSLRCALTSGNIAPTAPVTAMAALLTHLVLGSWLRFSQSSWQAIPTTHADAQLRMILG